ncbi:MAG: autotransporter outer membrane beta-barrel domain-containing protein, partial [Gammaproteobacteria bacterium]
QQENSIFKNVALATATLLASFFYNTAHALTDGSYTGTVSGFYEALGCSTPGFDTPFGGVSYSGATATLVVSNNGLNVTMSISQSGTFTATGVGSESGGTLNLDFVTGAGNLNIQANSTGDSITPSSVLTTPDLLNTQITNMTSTLGGRIDDVLRGFYSAFNLTSSGALYSIDSGLNAGDKTFKVGAWASYSYTDFENEFTLTAFEGKRHGGLIGIDIIPWENSVWGIAGGYEKNDIETGFNRGEQDTDGYSVVSYFGALLTNTWSVDLSAGYTWLKTDQFRTDPLTNNRVSSSPDADRWFGAFNLNGLWIIDNWILGANAGALYARNTEDSFIESDGTLISSRVTRLSQVNAGGNVAYSFGNFEPFVRGSYEYDVNATDIGVVGPVQPSFDDDNFLVGAGIRYFNNRGLSGSIEYYTRLDREDYKEENLVIMLRGEF